MRKQTSFLCWCHDLRSILHLQIHIFDYLDIRCDPYLCIIILVASVFSLLLNLSIWLNMYCGFSNLTVPLVSFVDMIKDRQPAFLYEQNVSHSSPYIFLIHTRLIYRWSYYKRWEEVIEIVFFSVVIIITNVNKYVSSKDNLEGICSRKKYSVKYITTM